MTALLLASTRVQRGASRGLRISLTLSWGRSQGLLGLPPHIQHTWKGGQHGRSWFGEGGSKDESRTWWPWDAL